MFYKSQVYSVKNPPVEVFNQYERAVRTMYNHFCFRYTNSKPWLKLNYEKNKDEKIDWKPHNEYRSHFNLSKYFTKIRKGEVQIKDKKGDVVDMSYLKELSYNVVADSSCVRFSNAIKKMFEPGKGWFLKRAIPVSKKNPKPRKRSFRNPGDIQNFPKIKNFRKGDRASFFIRKTENIKFDLEDNTLFFSKKVGRLKLKIGKSHPDIDKDAKAIMATFNYDNALKKWLCKVTFELKSDPSKVSKEGKAIAIDENTKGKLAYYDMEGNSGIIQINTGKNMDKLIDRSQKKLSNKVFGSKRYYKEKQILTRRMRKKRLIKEDSLNTEAHKLKEYSYIIKENLNRKGMQKSAKGNVENPGKNVKAKSGLNRVFNDTAGYKFFNKLQMKGHEIIQIDPKYTSQTCSECGHVDKENRKDERFKCLKCDYKNDADINASRNIFLKCVFNKDYETFCESNKVSTSSAGGNPVLQECTESNRGSSVDRETINF